MRLYSKCGNRTHAMVGSMARWEKRLISAMVMASPAEGPSFLIAPEGIWEDSRSVSIYQCLSSSSDAALLPDSRGDVRRRLA